MKTKQMDYEARVGQISERRTPRKCAVCGDPASRAVMRAVKGKAPVVNTLRFACARHATLEKLYPVIVRVKLDPLPAKRAYTTPKGDQSMFYRDVMREMGGVVPMPDKPTKAELAEAGKRLARRNHNWPPLHLPGWRTAKLEDGKDRSLTGRQRKKWRHTLRMKLKAATAEARLEQSREMAKKIWG